jgi:hypothetical protein
VRGGRRRRKTDRTPLSLSPSLSLRKFWQKDISTISSSAREGEENSTDPPFSSRYVLSIIFLSSERVASWLQSIHLNVRKEELEMDSDSPS